MATKRKLGDLNAAAQEDDFVDPSDELKFICLGGGNEVGRSCHIIQYKGKTVMLDAGMHPAYDGLASLPFYDEFDLSQVDVLLISHFHVDHAASLPYVLAKTPFRGRVFMTHATKAIYKWLIADTVRVGSITSSSESRQAPLYTEQDHLSTFPRIEALDFYQRMSISGVNVTALPAGHVLGAAMYVVEIAGLKILFTGDYSREDDRHLVSASVPQNVGQIDLLITESTFGTASFPPRQQREAEMMRIITHILDRGGRVLMPVFALGTAQELLLILDEYWQKHPKYQKVPIYYASNLARKCMAVYQTYIGAMNDNIKRLFRERLAEAEASGVSGEAAKAGPWDFKYVRSLKSLDRFEDLGPCVMLATPGMMQNGASRELLERWAPDSKNGVVVTGYSVEGTMASMLLNEPEEISAVMTKGASATQPGRRPASEREQIKIPRRCTINEVSLIAHVDGAQNREFVEEVGASVVILVHGAKHNMTRFKSKLLSLNATKENKTKVLTPANCEEVTIPFVKDKIVKVVGRLARESHPPTSSDESQVISGVLVRNEEHSMSLMDPADLPEYAGLPITRVGERVHVNLGIGPELIKYGLSGYFGTVVELPFPSSSSNLVNGVKSYSNGTTKTSHPDLEDRGQITTFLIMDTVLVYVYDGGKVEIAWEGNATSDSIADAALGCVSEIAMSPAGIKFSESQRLNGSTHHHHPNGAEDDDLEEELTGKYDGKSKSTLAEAGLAGSAGLGRLCTLLEAQFGEDNIAPIKIPRKWYNRDTMSAFSTAANAEAVQSSLRKLMLESNASIPNGSSENDSLDDAVVLTPEEKSLLAQSEVQEEIQRLHSQGILVSGFEVRADKTVARVWLEDLSVECEGRIWKERVSAVVKGAAGAVWGAQCHSHPG